MKITISELKRRAKYQKSPGQQFTIIVDSGCVIEYPQESIEERDK